MLKNLKEKFKKGFSKKEIISIAIFAVVVITTIIAIIVNQTNEQSSRRKKIATDGELARAMTYDQFEDGDEAVDGTDNVKFSAFFLRDVNGDGYAEKIKGTCKQIGKEDTLYMEVNVQTDGILKNAKIEVDGKNFYLATTAPKDNELKDNYIGTNIKTLEFNDMANGTQKLLTGIVRSGDYSYSSSKTSAIGSNINNLSRNDNKITFTGTYVGSDGNEIEIKKEVVLQTDWYGTTSASISTSTSTYYDIQNRQNEEEGTLTLEAGIRAYEDNNQLNIEKNYVEGTIPQLNGFDPISVTMESSTDSFSYDETNRKFIATREAINDANGNIIKSVSRDNYYTLKIVYPLEAYKSLDASTVTISIPVMTYYEGYNNLNTEFTNPYKSNEAKSTLLYTYREEIPCDKPAEINVKVGEYATSPTYRYIVSKKKTLKIYNGISSEENDDLYNVEWYVTKGTKSTSDGLIMKERKDGEDITSDVLVKSDATTESMENLTANVGIGFGNANNFLAEDGFIKVYDDETDELLVTFTKADWGKYTKTFPYKFSMPVKHIRVETSETVDSQYLYVYSQKKLDDEYITTNYTREQFDELKYIRSQLSVYIGDIYLGTTTHMANYEAPYSIASLSISKNTLSTQLTEKNEILTIKATANESTNQVGWTNGSFLIKLPADIISTDINTVEINNSSISLTSYEYIEKDNGKFIKINTKNTSNTAQTFEVRIDTNITPDPRIATTTENFELWASNEEGVDYYYNSADIYDVNDNLNLDEKVHKSTTSVSLIAPNSLLTNQTASGFDKSGTQIVSPQIADVKPQLATVSQDTPEKTVRIGAQIKNNYADVITDVMILGKIPFEGNTYVLSGEDLGSEFTTKMTNAGIEVPEALQGKVVVYYSENETPDKDLSNAENGWKTAENITNWDNVKTYLIDFQDMEVASGAEYTFYYTIKVPNGEDYNKKAFSHHGVYFALKTSEGKYRTQTEPNKLGIRIAEKYNLELQKYQTGKTNLVPGATYKITKEATATEDEESKTAVTNAEGKLELQNLYAKRTYSIEEIKTPEDFELNTDVVKIIGTIQEDGSLQVEKTEGTTREDIEITKAGEDEPYKVTIKVEDEAKAKLKITKTEKDTTTPLRGIRYKITGTGLPESGKNVTTNTNGEITVKGLKIGEEYTLEETKATGYYLASPIKFTVTNTDGTYEINISEGIAKESTITEEENIPVINMNVEDEKIPTYNLEISKIKKVTSVTSGEDGIQQEETVYLQGAKFKLYKGTKELGNYITDENGKITISGLYQYIDEKDEEATYTLKETLAPEGYAKVKDITFKVDGTTGELKFINTEGKEEKYTVEGTTVKLIIEDSPSFKLIKKDAETGELLANIKFAIYNIENGAVPAKNSKGEIIGTKETIDGTEYYTVATDNNGELTVDLTEGMYKAVEVEAPEKYDISNSTYYFGIGTSREEKEEYKAIYAQGIGGIDGDSINSITGTSDGGYIVGGYFAGKIDLGNGVNLICKGSKDGMIIKYNASGEVEWAKAIGGYNDEIKTVVETNDGGYLVVGTFESSIDQGNGVNLTNKGSGDGMVIKYSSSGDVEWTKGIGGTKNDEISSVVGTNDGGCIIGGYFLSNSVDLGNEIILNNHNDEYSGYEIMIIKCSSGGEVEWAQGIGGKGSSLYVNSVSETSDGGYIVVGQGNGGGKIDLGNGIIVSLQQSSIYTDGLIIKYSSSGATEWAKTIKGGYDCSEYIKSVTETSDGGYIVGGYFDSDIIELGNQVKLYNKDQRNRYNYDGMIIKYSSSGEAEWGKVIGGSDGDEFIKLVTTTSDGGYVLGGYFESSSINLGNGMFLVNKGSTTYSDGMIIKYSSNGEVEWTKGMGGTNRDNINTVTEINDGDYIIGGNFKSDRIDLEDGISLINKGSTDGMVIKIEKVAVANPTVIEGQSIGGASSDAISSVAKTRDGGYIVGGDFYSSIIDLGNGVNLTNNSDASVGMIVKYDSYGDVQWFKEIEESSVNVVSETTDGGYIVGGTFESSIDLENGMNLISKGSRDGMIIKYSSNGDVEWAKGIGGSENDIITSLIETSDGEILVGGYFYSSNIDLGNGISLIQNSNDRYYADGMIIKCSSSGEVEWAQEMGGIYDDYIKSIVETEDGGYIVGGRFESTVDLGNGIIVTSNGNREGYSDGIVIKYNVSGEVEWAQKIGGNYDDEITSITETSDGGYIIGGYFKSESIDLGNEIVLTNKSDKEISFDDAAYKADGMIIKYNSRGEIDWAQRIGGDGDDRIELVVETKDKGYIVGGTFSSDYIQLGNGEIISQKGFRDGFVIKYNTIGAIEWTQEIGENNSSVGLNAVDEDLNGNYIVAGDFDGSSLRLGEKILTNKGSRDGFLCKITNEIGVPEIQELEVDNKRKEFEITTDVNEIDNIKGGSISGEDESKYEVVKYGDSSTKEIKMIPDENYEIIGITVNGEEYQFSSNEDGSYTMPAFTNMTEDKKVVVTYSLKDNKITINKVDKNSREKLDGATFKLDQLEERANPNNQDIIGELTDNGQEYTEKNIGDEVTGRLGELTNNGTYYFVQNEDGTYTPTNSRTYQVANGGTEGISSSTANSYITIDLTGLTGQYKVVVNASCSSENNYDYGYATITQTTTAPSYSSTTGRFMYACGTRSDKDYTSNLLESGKKYYLHLGYRKDSGGDISADQVVINSIKLYSLKTEKVKYNFINNGGSYESTNQGKDSTVANSYIPIDLTNYTGKYNLTVNAEVSSQSDYDYGYVTITESTTRPSYNNISGRFIYISGYQDYKDYTTVLQGGKMYYLHLGYYKDSYASSGSDKFMIKSVNISLNNSELYHTTVETNSEGQAITQIPFGKYSITETKAPDGYWLNETPIIVEFRSTDDSVHEFTFKDEAKAKLIVHHYIKGTTTKLAEDEYSEAHEGDSYITSPKLDLDKYELEVDDNGKLVLPENVTGTYSQTPTEVTYYYVEKKIPLTVHHYIEGTVTQVPLKDGTLAEDEIDSGLEGGTYTTSPILDEELSDEYELVEIPSNANGVYANDEIIVTYYYKKVTRKVQIQKVAEDGVTPLEGTKFRLEKEEITEYSEMTSNGQNYEYTNYDEIQKFDKSLVANGKVYEDITLKDEITDIDLLANMESYSDYYFEENDGKYIPTNGKTFQVANGGTDGIHDTQAYSYMIIDLTDRTGDYAVVINARGSCEENSDYGYAELAEEDFEDQPNRFMHITGTKSDADYTASLEGGKLYYLDLMYEKNDSVSTGEDQIVINSVKLYSADVVRTSYDFKENNGKYVPNNLSIENTVANSYIPIDLTEKTGRYAVVVNAETQINSSSGYLYATLNTSITAPAYDTSDGRFMYLSGINDAKDYVVYLDGGSLYYLHLGYFNETDKNNTVQINSINLYKTKYLNFAMSKVGDSFESNNTGLANTVSDSYVRIDLSNSDSAKLTVNAAISSQSGYDYGYAIVTDSPNKPIYNGSDGRLIYMSGEQSAKDYEMDLTGRKIYYLHIGYRKDASVDSGLDKFIVNSIKVSDYVVNNELITDENGKINITLPYGRYKLIETEALPEYELLGDATEFSIIKNYDESNVIKLVNEKKIGTVTVHHYIEGTTTPVPLADGTDAQDETKTGNVGDMYTTAAKTDISEGYESVSEPDNASGNYIDGNIEVIYYYKAIPASVLVHHYLEGTTTKLADDETIDGKVGDKYTTSVADVDEMYELVAEPDNKEGKMTKEQIVVTYYYQLKKYPYIVNYLEKDTDKVLHAAKKGDELVYGSAVNSIDEKIDIDGYVFDSFDKDVLTIGTENNEINIYYIKRNDLSYTVNYLEKDTNKVLHEQKVQTGMTFEDEITAQDEVIPIAGYDYDSADKATLTIMTEDNVINLYYTKKDAQVIVHYYEENTTKKLSEDVTINGKVDDPYTTVSATDVPIKYELVETPDNASGTMTEDTIEVIYYYRVKDAVVHVRYLEKGTNIELANSDRLNGKVEDDYQTMAKDIEGYQLVEHTGNEKGKFEVEPLTITYYYLYKTKATVQYIDKTTGAILEQSTTKGLEGDEFETESKDFENYVLIEEPAEKTVKMTKEEQVLKYYYSHVSGGVIEKHIDVISGQILANAVHNGNEGDAYNIPSRTFDGYDLVEDKLPENAKGTMKVDPVEVIYYYIYRTKVTTEYIDKTTGNRLTEDEVQDGHEGDNYTTERKLFDGYKLIEVPANADGSMTKEDITVTYYYTRTSGGVIVNHLDVKTNKQLLDETKEEGYEGDPYETHEENISGYDLVKDKYPENATGTMTTETIRVTYYYIKKTEVNVKYVNKETGEEIDVPTNIPGHEGDDYKTEPKDVPGYDLIEEPENKDGTMTADSIDVIYYYRRPAKVIVNYYDADTKKKLADEVEITGHQGDSYTTEEKDIKYYKVETLPANKDGKMTVTVTKDENGKEIVEDTTYVNYYYRKLIFNLRVDKTIASVIVNGQETAINGNLGKVEVHRKELSTANVKVVYKIKVTNDSELTGKANVVENIPSGMTMKLDNNPGWTINETTASIETDEIKPGESREYQVVLGWQNGDGNVGTKENVANIVTENEAGFNEQFDTDNVSRADLIVAVGTGEVPYVAIAGGVLMIMIAMTAGVYVIKKKRQ